MRFDLRLQRIQFGLADRLLLFNHALQKLVNLFNHMVVSVIQLFEFIAVLLCVHFHKISARGFVHRPQQLLNRFDNAA
ncbi:hypothetical protein D1872_222190 [compost metagenome]